MNHLRLVFALSFALLGACATSTEPVSTSEETQSIILPPPEECCSWGSFTCPSNGNISFDYDPPGCGTLTKPRARNACQTACGAPCIDSGWFDQCTQGEAP